MRILLPVDGSTCSTRAVRYVAEHLRDFGARPAITLLNVDPPLLEHISPYVGPEDIARYHEKNARAALRPAQRILGKKGIRHRERLAIGDPATSIARIAREERCAVIVMGSHGRGAIRSMLLGSVVTKVLALTRIPLLLIR